MKILPGFILLIALLSINCKGKQSPIQGGSGSKPPIKTLSIYFYPHWGGSSEAILERKNGSDKLYSTYRMKVNGVDTILTHLEIINTSTADSIYSLAELVQWNDDANRGTVETRVGLKFLMSFQKGRSTKSVSWESLANANELPQDIKTVIEAINKLTPADFKLY